MIKQKNYPKVFFDNGGVFTDISILMASYGRDTAVIPIETTDFLYFGRVKPFDCMYLEVKVANAVSTTMVVEYYNGSTWEDVSNLSDDTNEFGRNGFIQFDKPEDWSSVAVNAQTLYYVRISFLANITPATELQGLNILFSDDQDLVGVYPGVMMYLDSSETSFVLRHENARDKIVQSIRNEGFQKYPSLSNHYASYDEWDFLKIEEVRLWSTYLVMANIFSTLQSNNSDMYKEKTEEYLKEAELYKAAFYLSLDSDDDGELDNGEQAGNIYSRRLVRR